MNQFNHLHTIATFATSQRKSQKKFKLKKI